MILIWCRQFWACVLFVGILPAHLWQILLRHLLTQSCEAKPKSRMTKNAKISKMDSFRFLWIPWNTFVVWETATLRLLLCRSTRMGQMEVERQVKDRAEELQVAQSSRSMCGKYLPHPSTFYRNLVDKLLWTRPQPNRSAYGAFCGAFPWAVRMPNCSFMWAVTASLRWAAAKAMVSASAKIRRAYGQSQWMTCQISIFLCFPLIWTLTLTWHTSQHLRLLQQLLHPLEILLEPQTEYT